MQGILLAVRVARGSQLQILIMIKIGEVTAQIRMDLAGIKFAVGHVLLVTSQKLFGLVYKDIPGL